jgi:GT2 family glycosyltransferase
MSLSVAFCIPTHNRLADIQRTLNALAALDPSANEIIVAADGCNDGTAEWIREAHPSVKLVVHDTAQGCIPSRNEIFAMVKSDIIFTLDDDSYPIECDAVAKVRELFERNPCLGAADFPQVTDEKPETLDWTLPQFGDAHFRGFFVSAAAAFRTKLFGELGGYSGMFFHMYEEPDFCQRILAAGWQVRFEPVLRVRHHWSGAGRSEIRNHHRHARNEMWSVLMRCPFPWLPFVAAFRAFRQAGYAAKRGWLLREPVWWWLTLKGIGKALRQRRPIAWRAYRGWMEIVRCPHEDRAKWESVFGK